MEKTDEIKVATIIGDKIEYDKSFSNSLESLREFVGGYIEIPFVSQILMNNNIIMVINEEGKIDELPITAILTKGSSVVDTIHGNILFAGNDGHGEIIGLTSSQMDVLKHLFKDMVVYNNKCICFNIPII